MRAVLLLALGVSTLAEAGPWTREKGSYYTKTGADGYWALDWDQAGSAVMDSDRYLGQQYSVYGELGLPTGHPVQLAISAPLTVGTVWFTRKADGQTAEGRATVMRAGDLRLRPQVAIHPTKPIAAALEIKLPMYGVDGVCDDNPQFRDLCPRPGDGQIDLTGWALVGGGFNWGFAEVGLGYQHRTEWYLGWDTPLAFGDSVVFTAGGGASAGPVLIMARVDGNWWPDDDGVTSQQTRVGPSVLVDVAEGIAIEARSQLDVVARHAGRGLGFGVGISARK
jgi:hypothetical protein